MCTPPPEIPEVVHNSDEEAGIDQYKYRIHDATDLNATFNYGDVDEEGRPILDGG